MPNRRREAPVRIATMAVFAAAAALWVSRASASCEQLSVSDAHVLTKAQLTKRVCGDKALADERQAAYDARREAYAKAGAANAYSDKDQLDLNFSLTCTLAAAHNEQLYRERFGKPSGCMKLDKDKK